MKRLEQANERWSKTKPCRGRWMRSGGNDLHWLDEEGGGEDLDFSLDLHLASP